MPDNLKTWVSVSVCVCASTLCIFVAMDRGRDRGGGRRGQGLRRYQRVSQCRSILRTRMLIRNWHVWPDRRDRGEETPLSVPAHVRYVCEEGRARGDCTLVHWPHPDEQQQWNRQRKRWRVVWKISEKWVLNTTLGSGLCVSSIVIVIFLFLFFFLHFSPSLFLFCDFILRENRKCLWQTNALASAFWENTMNNFPYKLKRKQKKKTNEKQVSGSSLGKVRALYPINHKPKYTHLSTVLRDPLFVGAICVFDKRALWGSNQLTKRPFQSSRPRYAPKKRIYEKNGRHRKLSLSLENIYLFSIKSFRLVKRCAKYQNAAQFQFQFHHAGRDDYAAALVFFSSCFFFFIFYFSFFVLASVFCRY